jgi:guanylate kinase
MAGASAIGYTQFCPIGRSFALVTITMIDAEPQNPYDGLLPSRGRLFVVSGPSGVGKGTVIAGLLAPLAAPSCLVRCTTATTRAPRPGEVNGLNYHFFSRPEFERRIADGFFLEYAPYNENLYGTPRESVERERHAGNDVILEIEVQGGVAVRGVDPSAVLIFLAPPSWHELERRLRSRATDDPETVARRMAIARREMEAAPHYDYLIVNDSVESATDTLRSIVLAERRRIVRHEKRIDVQ